MATSIEFTTQWTNPTEVTTVLMVIGADVVQKALAQCTGTLYAPVCFSFGWVSFAFVVLVNVLGDGRLLPPPDYPVKIFNLNSGSVRDNKNWVIGRILRDHERSMWKQHGLHSSGIRITVFEAVERPGQGQKMRISGSPFSYGWIHVWGLFVTILQLVIAAIPIILDRDWGIMVITGGGIFLALVFGAIPQWTVEKLPSRMRSRSTFALTSGNGAKDIMVIKGLGKCWDLEDFAALDSPRNGGAWDTFKLLRAAPETASRGWTFFPRPKAHPAPDTKESGGGTKGNLRRASTTFFRNSSFVTASRDFWGVPLGFAVTMAVCIIQSFLWLVLLITVAALKSNTWYLVAVGGLGMFQNAILAAMTRPAERRGLYLRRVDKILTKKVMDGLMDLESEHGCPKHGCPKHGAEPGAEHDCADHLCAQPLVGEFFSGKLHPVEEAWWKGDRGTYDRARKRDPRRGIPRSYLRKNTSYDFAISELSVVPSLSEPIARDEMEIATVSLPRPASDVEASAPNKATGPGEMVPRHPSKPRAVSYARHGPSSRYREPERPKRSSTIASDSTTGSSRPPDSEVPRDGEQDLMGLSPLARTHDMPTTTSRHATTMLSGYRQTINFPLDEIPTMLGGSDSETSVGRGKGKQKEMSNPFDELKSDVTWPSWR